MLLLTTVSLLAAAPLFEENTAPGFESVAAPMVMIGKSKVEGQRQTTEGKVTKVAGPEKGVFTVQVGESQFQVWLPPKLKLPIETGDAIRAELWTLDGKVHARVTDEKDTPLIFTNENPVGWAFELGVIAEHVAKKPKREEHEVILRIGDEIATHMYGWRRGAVGDNVYLVWGQASVVETKRSVLAGVVRIRERAPSAQ